MNIKKIDGGFAVCKVKDYSGVDLERPFTFTGRTDGEKSLVCPEERMPENALVRERGWRAFRIEGTLKFSLVGILAGISGLLARRGISIFALSTYDTDYVLLKRDRFDEVMDIFAAAGYGIL